MDQIKVTITPEDFRDALNGYWSAFVDVDGKFRPCKCPLFIALERMFGEKIRSVGNTEVHIQYPLEKYSIDAEWGEYEYTPDRIDELSKMAKESLDGIPTVEVLLTRFS